MTYAGVRRTGDFYEENDVYVMSLNPGARLRLAMPGESVAVGEHYIGKAKVLPLPGNASDVVRYHEETATALVGKRKSVPALALFKALGEALGYEIEG